MLTRLNKYIVLSFAFLLIIPRMNAQNIGEFFKYGEKHGLNASLVLSVYQDNIGILWIATHDGLYKYDGYEFKSFKYDLNDSLTISDNWVLKIFFEDSKNGLWLLTANGIINRFDLKKEIFEQVVKFDEFSLDKESNYLVNYLTEDYNNNVWISYRDRLFKYNSATKALSKVKIERGFIVNSKSYSYVDSIFYISTDFGLGFFDDSSNEFEIILKDEIKSNIVKKNKTIYYSNQDYLFSYNLLTGAKTKILDQNFNELVLNKDILWGKFQNTFVKYDLTKDVQKSYFFNYSLNFPNFFLDEDGLPWIIDNNGVYKHDTLTDTFKEYKFGEKIDDSFRKILFFSDAEKNKWIIFANPSGEKNISFILKPNKTGLLKLNSTEETYFITGGYVDDVYIDNFKNIWLSGNYLKSIKPRKTKFYHYRYKQPNNLKSMNSSIYGMDEIGDKIILAGQKGLYLFNPESEIFTTPDFLKKLDEYVFTSIIALNERYVYASAQMGGVFEIDFKEQKVKRYQHSLNDSNSIAYNSTQDLFIDKSGNLWIAILHYGIDMMNLNNKRITHISNERNNPNSLYDNFIWEINQGIDSIFWFATNNSLERYNAKTKKFNHYLFSRNDTGHLIANKVFCIHPDEENNIWLGTMGNGLIKFNTTNNTFKYITEKDGLCNNTIYGILKSDTGGLWISTNNGISSYNIHDNKLKCYNSSYGLINSEFNSNAFLKSKGGRLYFGGTKGLTAFYPNEIKVDSIPPPVVITKFYLFGNELDVNAYNLDTTKSIFLKENDYFLNTNISYVDNIELNYRENYFTVEFSALNFNNQNGVNYKYRLKGSDENWINSENRNFATYNKLSPGHYEFQVTASNKDGIWNQHPAKIKITILPPFWLTKWFFLIVGLLVLMAITVIIKFRERKLKLQKKKLETKVIKRTNEIRTKNIELERQNELIKQQKKEIAFQARQIKSELIAQNKESELALLRSQINPHFLFNTLNNINTLVFIDQQKTYDAILKLSEIMRYMHHEQTPEFVTLEKEVEYIRNFVELQRLRFKNEKYVELAIEVENHHVLVAPMIFIAFVENAFKHCNKKDKTPAIKIEIVSQNEYITLNVENYYSKKEKRREPSGGFGLKNIRERLELIYRDSYKLNISDRNGVFKVELQLLRKNGKNGSKN